MVTPGDRSDPQPQVIDFTASGHFSAKLSVLQQNTFVFFFFVSAQTLLLLLGCLLLAW